MGNFFFRGSGAQNLLANYNYVKSIMGQMVEYMR